MIGSNASTVCIDRPKLDLIGSYLSKVKHVIVTIMLTASWECLTRGDGYSKGDR